MELTYTRADMTRISLALQSCIMACDASETGQIPGTRPYQEARELTSIRSGIIALIEAGQEDSVYTFKVTRPANRRAESLPGLGGKPYNGPRLIQSGRNGETETIQQEPGETSEGNGQRVPSEKSTEEGQT